MPDFLDQIKAKLQGVVGSWAAYSALGSFILYLLGYLAVRFHLTTLGIGTDLSVLDERYLFTGAKFLVYLVSVVPIVLLLGLMACVPLLPFWIARLIRNRRATGKKTEAAPDSTHENSRSLRDFVTGPTAIALLALVIAVVMIQFVMRQCFFFTNLLLASSLPPTSLNLHRLMFEGYEGWQSLYFSALVAATFLTAFLLYLAITRTSATPAPKPLLFVVGLLLAIQFLFLPVNYGVFILEKDIPKVTDLGDQNTLKAGDEAWLVWEGSQGMTYLVATNGPQFGQRRLVTVPKKDFKRLEIVQYDGIISRIFNH
jgi:hypothetical protein